MYTPRDKLTQDSEQNEVAVAENLGGKIDICILNN